VRAEIGTVSTAVAAPSADFQIPERSTDEFGQAPHLAFGRIFSPTGSGAYPPHPLGRAESRSRSPAAPGAPPKNPEEDPKNPEEDPKNSEEDPKNPEEDP